MTLKDGLKNIQEALEAHRMGPFTLSVPAQKVQSEGLITAMLVMRGMVLRDGSKARRSDNRAELAGLKEKIDLYTHQFQYISPVNRVRQFIGEVSTHLLVLIYYFGSQLMARERYWR